MSKGMTSDGKLGVFCRHVSDDMSLTLLGVVSLILENDNHQIGFWTECSNSKHWQIRNGKKNEHRPLQHRSSWAAQKQLKRQKVFKDLQKSSKTFKNLQKSSKTFENLQKPSKIFKNLRKSSKTFKNLQKPSKIFKNLQIPSKQLQKSSNDLQKSSKHLQNIFKKSSNLQTLLLICNFFVKFLHWSSKIFWNFFIDLWKFFEISSLTSKHMVPNFQHAVPKTVSGLKVSCFVWFLSCFLSIVVRSEWTKAFSLIDFEVQLGHQEELGQNPNWLNSSWCPSRNGGNASVSLDQFRA